MVSFVSSPICGLDEDENGASVFVAVAKNLPILSPLTRRAVPKRAMRPFRSSPFADPTAGGKPGLLAAGAVVAEVEMMAGCVDATSRETPNSVAAGRAVEVDSRTLGVVYTLGAVVVLGRGRSSAAPAEMFRFDKDMSRVSVPFGLKTASSIGFRVPAPLRDTGAEKFLRGSVVPPPGSAGSGASFPCPPLRRRTDRRNELPLCAFLICECGQSALERRPCFHHDKA